MATTTPKRIKIFDQFFALPVRERVLVVFALSGIIFLFADYAWIRPQQAQARKLHDRVEQQENEIGQLSRNMQVFTSPPSPNANAGLRAERDRLRAITDEVDKILQRASSDVRMGEIVRTVTANSPAVTLVSLRTMPSQKFFAGNAQEIAKAIPQAPKPGSSAPAAAPMVLPTIYRHGVEITLRGPYGALVPYVNALEKSMPGVYWGSAKLDAAAYPDNTLKLVMYTLSTQPEPSLE